MTLPDSILSTICFFDCWQRPMTILDLEKYLIGQRTDQKKIAWALKTNLKLKKYLKKKKDFWQLKSSPDIIISWLTRQRQTRKFWRRHYPMFKSFLGLPFIKMVGVTGSLMVDGAMPKSDIDLFIVAKAKRVHLTRFALRGLIKFLAWKNDLSEKFFCPTFLIDNAHLDRIEHDIFSAFEIGAMKLIWGRETYERLLNRNKWVRKIFPKAYSEARLKEEIFKMDQDLQTKQDFWAGFAPGELGDWFEQQALRRTQRLIEEEKKNYKDDIDNKLWSANRYINSGRPQRKIRQCFESEIKRIGLIRPIKQIGIDIF